MPTPRAARSAATAAALLLALTGCSLFDRDSGSGADQATPEVSAPEVSATRSPSASPTETPSVSTVREACARAGETARDARDKLREDPAELLAEIDELVETAPPELSEEIAAVRDAVDGYRKGERSYLGVLREAKDLQDRCTT